MKLKKILLGVTNENLCETFIDSYRQNRFVQKIQILLDLAQNIAN